jgi:hypothetical protein
MVLNDQGVPLYENGRALDGTNVEVYQAALQGVITEARRKDNKAPTWELIEGDDLWSARLGEVEGKKQSHEIYLGVMADVLLNPAIYFAYDFTQKKANIEGTIGYTFDLGSFGANGLAIDLGAKCGYTRVKKPDGISRTTQVAFLTIDKDTVHLTKGNLYDKKGWFYVGANADLVYSLNEHTKARAGVAFSYNNANKNSWINEFNGKKHNVWFSSALEFSF